MFWNSSGKSPLFTAVYQTSGWTTGGSTRRPVLWAESFTGGRQSNGSPDSPVAKS